MSLLAAYAPGKINVAISGKSRLEVLGLLVHTDAAFAGQGVVAEVLQLSQLPSYSTNGTVHIVINNQIGFTTNPTEGRTSVYCTDVARAIGAPVLHVNANDVDAVVRTAAIAAEFRHRFKADIVIDLVCYRRLGHNEVDEPKFTQPLMYRAIELMKTVRDQYVDRLVSEGVVQAGEADELAAAQFQRFDSAYQTLNEYRPNWFGALSLGKSDTGIQEHDENSTGVDLDTLRAIGLALSIPPAGMACNDKVLKQLRERGDVIRSGNGITFPFAEALAFVSLSCEGRNVRFSGQDSPRGAFSQRHFCLIDQNTGANREHLAGLRPGQSRCQIIGSPLSEYSVLGFEYGYSVDSTGDLVVWEAQFGDFANVAQVIFDQFIASAQDKWLDTSALTVMLPHGLEGQGPDHSSGRIERFLQMCAGNNITVANCSSPANFFHLLRRQASASRRRPLIVFTNKSLLRHRAAASSLAEFGPGTHFRTVICSDVQSTEGVRRVLLCSGKIFFELAASIRDQERADVAVVRIEQLYPFPESALCQELSQYPHADIVWCQEEPENMGAWSFVDRKIEKILKQLGNASEWPRCFSRPANASTAIGTHHEHDADQRQLIDRAIGIPAQTDEIVSHE